MALADDRRKTILLVDDDFEVVSSFKRLLERFLPDAKVFTAESGPAGLRVLKRRKVDLVLVDYRMPSMDGIEFLVEVKKINPQAKRAVFTAFAASDLEQRAAQAGVDAFVPKEEESEEFLRRVARLLETEPAPSRGRKSKSKR